MYQVIIVDDEPRILEGIIHLFPWNNFGFEVVASFTNGKEALEYINAHPQGGYRYDRYPDALS